MARLAGKYEAAIATVTKSAAAVKNEKAYRGVTPNSSPSSSRVIAPAACRLLVAMLARPDIAQLTRLFASDSTSETQQAYLLSALLVDDLRRRHGAQLPGAIVARVAEGVPFDRAFQQETGVTPDAAAARAWAGYRRWTAWVPAVTSPSAAWLLIVALAIVAFAAQRRRRAARRRQWQEDPFDM